MEHITQTTQRVYTICRRAESHKDNCEDSFFTLDHKSMFICGVFDGCSTGVNSHFASALLAECMRKAFDSSYKIGAVLYELNSYDPSGLMEFIDSCMMMASLQFNSIRVALSLPELNCLSTACIAVYHKESKKLFYKFLGDGSIFYRNSAKTPILHASRVQFEGNAPDYLAYHLNTPDLLQWIEKQEGRCIDDITDFCLCTDGIDSGRYIVKPETGIVNEQKAPIHYLLQDTYLSASVKMLQRKVNILKTTHHYIFDDDLTIIRYENGTD